MKLYGLKIKKDIQKEDFERLLSNLSIEKKEQIKRYKKYKDSLRSLIANILLNIILAKEADIKIDEMSFYKNEFGKPYLRNTDNIYFNISHSYDWIVLAIDNMPIGIDIEKVKDVNLGVAKRFFTYDEYKYIISLEKEKRVDSFYKIWTLKESYIKYKGLALYIALKSFSIIPRGDMAEIKTYNNDIDNCYFKMYNIDKNYKMSVCASNDKFPDHIIVKNIDYILKNDVLSIK